MTDSSPFIDHPRYDDIDDSTKQIISKLQFQISSSKTEQRLLVESKKDLSNQYEQLLKAKNEELESLKVNFEFVYNQREALKSKLENSEQTSSAKIQALQASVDESHSTVKTLERQNYELKSELSLVRNSGDQESNTIRYLKEENEQLQERIDELTSVNSELIDERDSISQRLRQEVDSSAGANSYQHTLKTNNLQLQKMNNSLQLKVDSLLQHKTSVEILKQKNHTLQQKLDQLESVQEKCYELEIEALDLKSQLEEFKKVFSEIDQSVSIKSIVDQFKQVTNNNLVLEDKFNQARIELDQVLRELQKVSNEKKNELVPKIQSLTEVLKNRQELVEKLEKQKLLNVKEIQYLRESLKTLDDLSVPKGEDNSEVKRLEKVIEIYKGERDGLIERVRQTEQSQTSIPDPSPVLNSSGKRPRTANTEDDDTINTAHFKLQKENISLLSTVKTLQDEISSLNSQISKFHQVQTKKEQIKVLQLRANNISKDQLVKQHTIDLLRKENKDLISNSQSDSIPRSVFERQEDDKEILQTKIDQLSKRISRLREVYSKKSCDILSIISKFFGYSVEFLPSPINPEDLTSSRIKLVSKYIQDSSAYLVIDVNSKLLKANGSNDFKQMCEELVTNWVNGKDQIPCFLGALNLKLYASYEKRKSAEN
ncbi:spindle assembly checkpoint component Mad1p [[Candida] railenensis]|uniref:Spindle assembly checkpoint component MAD1 n=1 Tax=[Candida] railenensis TaxID=45579 RepID=A0A9P0QV20_9ASCO|nr:spindle assembly checkpoint component Mad1p [[Candida] railenensis]